MMGGINTLLQADVAGRGQLLITATVVLLVAAGVLAIKLRQPYAGLPDELRENKRALRHSFGSQKPRSLRVTSVAELYERRDDICKIIDGSLDRVSDEESVTLSEAAGLVHTELLKAWSEKATRIPRLSLRFAEEAVAILILGAAATLSITTFRRAFAAGKGASLLVALDSLQQYLKTGVSTGIDGLTAFPYAGFIWDLAFAYSILAAQWVFDNPWPIVVLLAALSVTLVYIDRHAPEVEEFEVLTESRRSLTLATLAVFALVWLAGVVPATTGAVLGFPAIGSAIGLLFAGSIFALACYVGYSTLRIRIKRLVILAEGETRLELIGLLLRRFGLGVAALFAPLIPIYAIHILVTGRLAAIAGAWLAGSPGIKLLTVVVVLVALGAAAVQVRDVWPDVRLALSESISRRAVRIIGAQKVFPALVFTFLALVGIAMSFPGVLTIGIALSATIVARLLGSNYLRLRDRLDQYEPDPATASRVVIDAYTLRTADSTFNPLYYARVNGEAVAATDPETLTNAIVVVAEELFKHGQADPSIESAHATNAMQYGIVDVEETRRKLRTETRDIVKYAYREGDCGVENVKETLSEEVPEPVWRQWLDEKMGKGKIQIRRGDYEVIGE